MTFNKPFLADSGEKISLGVTILLSLTVFQLIVAEQMPPSEDIPVIGKNSITQKVISCVQISNLLIDLCNIFRRILFIHDGASVNVNSCYVLGF